MVTGVLTTEVTAAVVVVATCLMVLLAAAVAAVELATGSRTHRRFALSRMLHTTEVSVQQNVAQQQIRQAIWGHSNT